ncbi:MAG: FGGY family carbohydrate kinase [Spirochaetia bacterium]|jgi:xylulokinase
MSERHLIAIDVGVSFIKVGVYDEHGGKKAGSSRRVPTQQPEPGTFSQDPDELYDLARDALREAVTESGVSGKSVAAIAISGAMGGAMGVDAHWQPVTDWSIISDSRFMPHAVAMQEGAHQAILEQSGTNLPVLGAKTIWWRKSFPEAYARTAKFVVIGGYIAAKLGGIGIEDAFIDRTYLNFTGIANLAHDDWSKEICGQFGIDRRRLPRVVASNAVIGRLTPESAIECGLTAGTPIVAGAGDKPAGTLGAGLVGPGLVVDEAASFGALSLCMDRYVPDARHRTLENLPSPIPGLFLPSVFLNGSGLTNAWFADTFGGEERREAAASGGGVYELLAAKAAKVPPGSEGLIALGLMGGRSYPSDPAIRGMWLGQSWFHRKEHFYRALLEGIAYEYATALAIMRENYPEVSFEEIRVIGGGARSDLWNQIKADVMGVRYVRLARDDYAMLGDILLAGSAVGVFSDPALDASRFAGSDRTYTPDARRTAHYARYVDIYRGLFDRERELFESLQKIPPYGEETTT